MKAKCIRTFIEPPSSEVMNGDMRGYLEINQEYIVFGIRFSKSSTYLYVFNDQHLVEVPIALFEVVDGAVYQKWIFKLDPYGEVTLWPEIFYTETFLENFSEHETLEREMFEKLRKEMEYL